MSADRLRDLLDRNDRHCEALPPGAFETLRDGQEPSVVSICCSDARVSQEGMWDVAEPGLVFTASNIGNQVCEQRAGDLVVSGSVAYPVHHTGTETIVVVGHTGCGAVTAAYRAATGGALPSDPGVRGAVETLLPTIEGGIDAGLTDGVDEATAIDRLVEHNVSAQVAFLLAADSIPEHVDVYGFVYDFHRSYGDTDGRAYLVDANGVTDLEALESLVGDDRSHHVGHLA
ncbi:MAG: carbonic anhydrase [Halobacteriota archaeon]